jgi:hypothetical protein
MVDASGIVQQSGLSMHQYDLRTRYESGILRTFPDPSNTRFRIDNEACCHTPTDQSHFTLHLWMPTIYKIAKAMRILLQYPQ